MYMTAHLVCASSGEEGINAFMHEHGPNFEWPEDAASLADSEPGKLVRRHIDLTPGSNIVRAYLDVLAPDGTPPSELEAGLAALAHDLHERRNPTVFVSGAVTIRFGVEPKLERIRAQQLDMLAAAALGVL